jgi:hypothetical protein
MSKRETNENTIEEVHQSMHHRRPEKPLREKFSFARCCDREPISSRLVELFLSDPRSALEREKLRRGFSLVLSFNAASLARRSLGSLGKYPRSVCTQSLACPHRFYVRCVGASIGNVW